MALLEKWSPSKELRDSSTNSTTFSNGSALLAAGCSKRSNRLQSDRRSNHMSRATTTKFESSYPASIRRMWTSGSRVAFSPSKVRVTKV